MFTLKKQLLIFLAHLKQLQRLRNCGIFLKLIYNNSYWMSGASICSVKSMFRHDLRSCSAIWASGAAQQGPSFGDVTFSGTRSKSRKKNPRWSWAIHFLKVARLLGRSLLLLGEGGMHPGELSSLWWSCSNRALYDGTSSPDWPLAVVLTSSSSLESRRDN